MAEGLVGGGGGERGGVALGTIAEGGMRRQWC